MAFDNHTQEQIQRYLDGDMSAGEQQTFEQRIASDEKLAQEIALQGEISSLLADTPENALRRNLQTLSDQYSKPSSGKRAWKNFIWLVPFLLLGLWWLSQPIHDEINALEGFEEYDPNSTISLPTIDSLELKENTIDTSNIKLTSPQEPEKEIPQPLDNLKDTTPKPAKKDSTKVPVYADKTESSSSADPIEPPMIMAAPSLLKHDFFAPLPLLDSLIAQNFQSQNFRITIQQALPDTLNLEETSKSNDRFIAILSLSPSLTELIPNIGLYLYPNHAFYWKENHPWDFTASKTKEINTNSYQVQLTPNLNLEPGLYYYALRSSKVGEVFFVGKLMITE